MRVVVIWSGGKDGYATYHRVKEQDHDVACLLTFVYPKPNIFHSYLIMQLQSKALETPLLKVKVKNPYQDIFTVLTRLNREEGVEGLVTGDIESVHKSTWDDMCGKLGMELITPLWDQPMGNRYRERVLNMELSTGMRAIINCVDLKYLGEEWVGREFDRTCVQEMKTLIGPLGTGIDAAGEFGEFHTTVLDSPLFKESIEITRFSKKKQVTDSGGLAPSGNFFYMDIKEAILRSKNR